MGGASGASPVGAGQSVASPGVGTESQMQQLQLQRQQQYQRLQQLQAQRDHVAHHHATVKAQACTLEDRIPTVSHFSVLTVHTSSSY